MTRSRAAVAALATATGIGMGVCQTGPALAALPGADTLTPVAGVPGNMNAPDLNGDGRPDIAVPLFGTDLLAVRINDGRGGFGPVRRYPVGLKPSFIARGDFNRDGKVDLAVSNAGSGDVSVLIGNGDGTLRAARNYPISGPSAGLLGMSNGTFSLEADDVNGDHLTDLVTSNSISNDVSVLLGRGNGTFRSAKTYPIAGPKSTGVIPFALSLGDLNGDGYPDAVTGGATSVTIMLNDGHGRFRAIGSQFVGFDIACTKVGDLNEDGKLDVVATGTGTLNAQVLLGTGDGGFRRGPNLFAGGFGAQCFSIGDLDQDGHLDLAVVNSGSTAGVGNVAILHGDGHGRFRSDPGKDSNPVNIAPWATDLADFNGDGRTDIVVANSLPPSVSLLLGKGDGGFRGQRTFPM